MKSRKTGFIFEGLWQIEAEKSILIEPNGKILFRYNANKINLAYGAKNQLKQGF
ncbi:MAG: hypothetical protein MZU84_03500 [Sphingobacterium sp.]|nr:hypothetical protein [Sphingobacterium sp.]